MSKFGKELIESMREAREHAEDTQVLLGQRLKITRRDGTFIVRRTPRGTYQVQRHHGEGRTLPPSPSSKLRVHVVPVPNVRAIRQKLGMSQAEFAEKYKIPLPTLKNWEQGRRQPDAPAAAYLLAISRRPNEISEALAV
jgi:putative transcriptional regulator